MNKISTEQVWELLGERLRAYFRARVSNAAAADDLVQEAFLRIHQRLDQLKDEDRLASWVFQIAHRLVVDHYRSRGQAAATLEANDELAVLDSAGQGSGEPADYNEHIAAWLPAAIELLPESQREIVRLFELEQVSQQEIAQRLGLSLTAVKSRVRRGRAALVETVDQCCVFELDRRGNILDFQRREDDCC